MKPFLPYLAAVFFFMLLLPFPVPAQDKQPLDTAKTKEETRDVNPFNPDQYHYVSWQDNMMGASPEAAKMTRYADTPVSNAYGQAEIGIPIFTVQSRSLELPIALSYDSSGIKPEEISGIVGLGWSLQAGGVITRTIVGRVDTGDEIPQESTNPSDAEWLVNHADSGIDTEYDRYSYNFCGHSGSFYKIPNRGIVPTEPTELIISETLPFTITDKDGTKYIFGLAETSTRHMGSYDPNAPLVNQTGNYYDLTTAWYLTEIRSMDGTDVITISYIQLNAFSHVSHSYYRSISFPYRYMGNDVWQTNLNGGFDPTPTFQTREWSFTTTHEWHPYVVSAITYNGGSVSFGYEGYSEPDNRYGSDSSTTPTESLSFTYNGPKRVGWIYDPNGNVTSDATNNVSIAWNVIDQPRMLTSGSSSTQRFYLADGTLSHIQDGTQMRIYLGDIVFKTVSGGVSVESAGWEGGRLLPGSGNDKVLYYVNDHLGSVRTVKDGVGTIRQRYDYYPYGSVSRSWSSGSTDTPDKRYRFSGKEIAGTVSNSTSSGSDSYLNYGARLYNPLTAMWLSQDPMAEKHYCQNPYLFCAASPINVVDPKGDDWFQNTITGEIYYNRDYTPADIGTGYMSVNPKDWLYLAPNDSFCYLDSFLTSNYATTKLDGGYLFKDLDATKAMNTVGFSLKPYMELVKVSKRVEFFPEGIDVIPMTWETEISSIIEKRIYVPNDYYQTYTRERIGNVVRRHPLMPPILVTLEEWSERRTYSYDPNPQKEKNNHPPFKDIILGVVKSLVQSL